MLLRQNAGSRGILIAVLAVIGAMTALACIRWHLWSDGSDTGTFSQAIVNTPHGFSDALEAGGTHFRTHWSPILALLWPLLALTRSPLALQIAQVVLIAISAVPLYALLTRYAGEAWALRCAVLALLYPPLLANAFAEFHELAFFPFLALTLIWAADRARWGWFALIAFLLVLVREDASADLIIVGIALGVLGIVRRRSRERGLLLGEPIEPRRLALGGFLLASGALCSLAIYAFIVLPRVGSWMPSHFYRYPFANGPLQTAASVVTHPLLLAHAVATRGRLTYLLEAFVPLAFLPLATRWTWLALPAFAGILLSSDQSVWRMGMHYVLLWAPWMVLSATWVLARIARAGTQQRALLWWRIAIALCVVFLIGFNPMHPAHYLRPEPYQHTAQALRAFACVPVDAPVATHDEWFSHEALAFPKITVLPDDVGDFRGYLVYDAAWRNPHFSRILPQIDTALAAGRFTMVCTAGTVHVIRFHSES